MSLWRDAVISHIGFAKCEIDQYKEGNTYDNNKSKDGKPLNRLELAQDYLKYAISCLPKVREENIWWENEKKKDAIRDRQLDRKIKFKRMTGIYFLRSLKVKLIRKLLYF